MALGGYNAGIGAVEAAGGVPQNSQTIAYVPKIMTLARTTFSEAGTLAAPGGAPAPDAPPTGGGDQAAGGCGGAPQVQVLALTYPGVSGPHAVDVYLPPGGGPGKPPVPMVVAIHGGGWFFGDRHELDQVSRDAAMHGYVIINGDYTLDAPRYPRELDDVRAEIAWARAHAGEWGATRRRWPPGATVRGRTWRSRWPPPATTPGCRPRWDGRVPTTWRICRRR